jgi:hypothetical protein
VVPECMKYCPPNASCSHAYADAATRDQLIRNDRVLFALLEDCPIPEFWTQYQDPSVQLYGDATRPAAHRLDDLVVRLYWLIYRKTKAAEDA